MKSSPLIGQGSTTEVLTEDAVRVLLEEVFRNATVDNRRLLVIIPDLTRSAPIPLLFRLLYEVLGSRVARLDYLIALGTHQPLSEAAIAKLVGVSSAERKAHYPKSEVYNHRWDDPAALQVVGTISSAEMNSLTGGLVNRETPINLNRMIHDYDELLILGPVFPHEVAGFSGGAKYLFPGTKGFAYLVAIMDLYSRKILGWQLSNSLDPRFCTAALEEALTQYSAPDIFNTDQGAQITAQAFTGVLDQHGVRISMDGKGRWIDNVSTLRFWRSLKYEEVYLYAYSGLSDARPRLDHNIRYYNRELRHSNLGKQTPDEVYYGTTSTQLLPVSPTSGSRALTPRPCS